MLTADFDYALPPELIAQTPPETRGTSRMMVLDRAAGTLAHRHIGDIGDYLRPGDLLVLNDTRVFPARFLGVWQDTGGGAEILLTDALGTETREDGGDYVSEWQALCGSGRKARQGHTVVAAHGHLLADILDAAPEGRTRLRLRSDAPLMDVLETYGLTPVPPYIRRDRDDPAMARLDRERYQTVYAREVGAVAAPTAGLHFTQALLDALEARGIRRAFVTLHVGPGTFRPVKAERVEDHRMDAERYRVPEATARLIAETRAAGGRVVAVGSTSVRTLETVAAEHDGEIVPCAGSSTAFIHPPYRFRAVDAMLTNFHLPQSTLIMMVAALAGRERVLEAYHEAVRLRYRFFSYGDCMLIL